MENETKGLSVTDIRKMNNISIYLLMKEKGARVNGLWSATKSELLKSFEEQIGFKEINPN